jgi:acyl-CoA dehydrogenase
LARSRVSDSALGLTPEQQRLTESVRRVARDDLVPLAEAGEPGRVNRALVRALAEHELLPRLFPKEVGGSREDDVSAVELCLLREAVAMESTAAETALAMQGLGGFPILRNGSDPMVRRWVPSIARGDAVAAFALSEPEHGSDAGALELRAERDGDGYRLTGAKAWISNAPDADVYTLFARTTQDAGSRGVTAFVVPGTRRDSPASPSTSWPPTL